MEEQSENLNKPKISYVYIKPNYNYLYIIFSVLLIVLVGSFLFNFLISKVLIKDALISNPIPGMYIKSLQNTYFIEGKFINEIPILPKICPPGILLLFLCEREHYEDETSHLYFRSITV